MSRYTVILTFVLITVAAAGLRFYKLGEWSFEGDELYTILEANYQFSGKIPPEYIFTDGHFRIGQFNPETSQIARLSKLNIAGHFPLWCGYKLFGENDFGSRVVPAAVGSLCIGVVFLLAYPLFGYSGALILAVFLLLHPDHVLQCQYNRFYIQTFSFAAIVFLLGAHTAVKRSVPAAVCLGPAAVIMVLSHSITGLLWGVMLFGCLADLLVNQNKKHTFAIASLLILYSLALLALAYFYMLPLMKDWNSQDPLRTSPFIAVYAFIFMLGWSFSMLLPPAMLYLWGQRKHPGNLYWLVCAVCCCAAVALLPIKIPVWYHRYSFVLSFPVIVVIALFINEIYKRFADFNLPYKSIAAVLTFFLLCSNLPSLASYFQDGGRADIRSAYSYIKQHWHPGDRICANPLDADFYIPELQPKVFRYKVEYEKAWQDILDKHSGGDSRLWITVPVGREGLNEETHKWLDKNAVYQTHFFKKRWDKDFNSIEIYYVPAQSK